MGNFQNVPCIVRWVEYYSVGEDAGPTAQNDKGGVEVDNVDGKSHQECVDVSNSEKKQAGPPVRLFSQQIAEKAPPETVSNDKGFHDNLSCSKTE